MQSAGCWSVDWIALHVENRLFQKLPDAGSDASASASGHAAPADGRYVLPVGDAEKHIIKDVQIRCKDGKMTSSRCNAPAKAPREFTSKNCL